MLKVIAFYLPQFHSIPLNDRVWGKGFTEWNSVKSGRPMFKGHNQPRVPLNGDYYNLLDENVIARQTEIARSNGVYGFCIYHYWFSGQLLLNKPLEIIRDSDKVNFPYTISWANESWGNAWTATGKVESFLEQRYGDKDEWRKHFEYLLTFFSDPNYIKENNKPLLTIYRPESIPNLNQMLDYWSELAVENGFDGIVYSYQQTDFAFNSHKDDSRFTYSVEYQPNYALYDKFFEGESKFHFAFRNFKISVRELLEKRKISQNLLDMYKNHKKVRLSDKGQGPLIYDYKDIANNVVNRVARDEKSIAGMFVGFDNTPRKQERGYVIQSTPELFEHYMDLQIRNVKKNYSNDYLYMFAWNEWGEGGYLEPDEKYGYEYLNIIKRAVEKYDQL